MRWIRLGFLLSFFIPAVAFCQNRELDPCPESPNCVNSFYQENEDHEPMAPLAYNGNGAEALASLIVLTDSLPRTTLVSSGRYYAHFEFTIALFGFVDDVEYECDTLRGVIHFRSASRTGYYDFGVNRRRMEEISEIWNSDKNNLKE